MSRGAHRLRRSAEYLSARNVMRAAGELALAGLLSALVAGLVLSVTARLHLPQPSHLPQALITTAGAVVVLLFALAVGWRRTPEKIVWLAAVLAPALLVATHLGILLADSPHYLNGLAGDQVFRVPYLERFSSTAHLRDVFYADAEPFYPPLWFWIGGRLAVLCGLPGWLFFKIFSVGTMAVAGPLAFVLWRRLLGLRTAAVLGLVTGIGGVQTGAYEPYSWILIALLPFMTVSVWLRLRSLLDAGPEIAGPEIAGRGDAQGEASRQVVVSGALTGVYLGLAALTYTLVAGFAVGVVVLVVLLACARWCRSRQAAIRAALWLGSAGMVTLLFALLFWRHYLGSLLSGRAHEASVAMNYLPETSAVLPTPMFNLSGLGVLCLIGLLWIAPCLLAGLRGRRACVQRGEADLSVSLPVLATAALGILALAGYGWYLLSGLLALAQTSLLPFRMIPIITLALALAAVLAAAALVRSVRPDAAAAPLAESPLAEPRHEIRTGVRVAALVLLGVAVLTAQQQVTDENREFADVARSASRALPVEVPVIEDLTRGRAPDATVLLSADPTLASYRPYFHFQAPNEAYAAPTGRYTKRNDEILRFASAASPRDLVAALDSSPFDPPTVFVLHRGWEGLTYPIAENQMPVQPDNRRTQIVFPPALFADPALFDFRDVGDYRVIVRR